MRRRVIWSFVFTISLFYISMGHMLGWPLPGFFLGTENSMIYALTLFLLALPVAIINNKYYRMGFKTLFHCSPNMLCSRGLAPLFDLVLMAVLFMDYPCTFLRRTTMLHDSIFL